MAQIRGFVCDGGCGSTAIAERPTDTHPHGWLVAYAPDGRVDVCSWECLLRVGVRKTTVKAIETPT